jgi:cyanophycin synthetase
MNILETRVYAGPGVHAYFPVIRLTVDLGILEQWPTGRLGREFQDALLELLPGLHEHRCSYGTSGGFVRRLREGRGTWLAHVLEHTAIELQCSVGSSVSFGRARETAAAGVYHVVYQYRDGALGERAGLLARDILASILPPALQGAAGARADFDAHAELSAFRDFARSRALGPSTSALVRAAEQRGIPWHRLDDDHLIQFGYGSRQRRIQATLTSLTSEIAVDVASDKALTNRLLRAMGIPVPRQAVVHTEEAALSAATRIGFPVVVKPRDGNHGRGVTPDVRTAGAVAVAFHAAREHGEEIIVEEHITGFDYRMLVVGERVVAAARRVPGSVVGDGVHTIAELVDIVNADPRRGAGHDNVLTRLALDAQALRLLSLHDLTPDGVPARRQMVPLRATGNLSTGGTAVDVTDELHPDNAAMAVRAARTVGLDVAGIDFISPDIGRAWSDAGGGVCEVNAAPGLRMHIAPAEGTPRDVAGAIVDFLFPRPADASIPIAAITGTNGKTTTARMVAHIVAGHLGRVGLATSDGIYIDARRVAAGDTTGPISAQMLLHDSGVDAVVLETARGGILRAGLAFRRCTVGAVLNVTRDHIGLDGIETVEALAALKRTVIEVAADTAVLNADDPLCLAMLEHTPARRKCLVSMRQDNPDVAQHVERGGIAVVLAGAADAAAIVLLDGSARTDVIETRAIPATLGGLAQFNTANALFATAIAHSLGVPLPLIASRLRSFDTTFARVPGRLNICDMHPFRVVLDYAHNPAAVEAMGRTALAMAPDAQRICVLAAPGDRGDDDIRAVGRAAAPHFHRVVCRHDTSLRGRTADEVPRLLREGLLAAGMAPDAVEMIPDEIPAITAALHHARAGDLVVVFCDAVEDAWRAIVDFKAALAPQCLPASITRAHSAGRRVVAAPVS